jgi:hypothetical protein
MFERKASLDEVWELMLNCVTICKTEEERIVVYEALVEMAEKRDSQDLKKSMIELFALKPRY